MAVSIDYFLIVFAFPNDLRCLTVAAGIYLRHVFEETKHLARCLMLIYNVAGSLNCIELITCGYSEGRTQNSPFLEDVCAGI